MTIQKSPDSGIPDNAPEKEKKFIPEVGESTMDTWRGAGDDLDAKYELMKVGTANLADLTLNKNNGRATLIARYGRSGGGSVGGDPDDVSVIEELWAIDVIKDIELAPYFTAGGAAELSDDQASYVKKCVQESWTSAEITEHAPEAAFIWVDWTDAMIELRYHLLHGNTSYYETAFVLRVSKHGVRTSEIKASLDNINEVVTAPTFSTPMDDLVASLPDGEWVKRPPGVQHMGRGKWRVDLEYQWATQWSIVYGGTFTGLTTTTSTT